MQLKYLFLLFALSLCGKLLSQSANSEVQETPKEVFISARAFVNPYLSTGEEQYFNDWTKGEIIFEDGRKAENIIIRYNSALDEILWLRQSDFQVGIVYKDIVKEFTFYPEEGSRSTRFVKRSNNKVFLLESKDILLQVLTEGEASLYCYRKKTFIKNSDVFKNNYAYYLYRNNSYSTVLINRKGLLSNFSKEDKKTLKSILKQHKLRVSKEVDFIKALEYFNDIKNNS